MGCQERGGFAGGALGRGVLTVASEGNLVVTSKVLSTKDDPADGMMSGLAELAAVVGKLPVELVPLNELPRNTNGKIHKRGLAQAGGRWPIR